MQDIWVRLSDAMEALVVCLVIITITVALVMLFAPHG